MLLNNCRKMTTFAFRTFVRNASTERSFNRVTLIGRVGGDAQLKGTFEHPVVNFSIATTSGPKTEWHRISVFKNGLRSLAENYVKQGARLLVEGKLSYGHLIDSQGVTTPITTIIADDIVFLSKNGKAEAEDGEVDVAKTMA